MTESVTKNIEVSEEIDTQFKTLKQMLGHSSEEETFYWLVGLGVKVTSLVSAEDKKVLLLSQQNDSEPCSTCGRRPFKRETAVTV